MPGCKPSGPVSKVGCFLLVPCWRQSWNNLGQIKERREQAQWRENYCNMLSFNTCDWLNCFVVTLGVLVFVPHTNHWVRAENPPTTNLSLSWPIAPSSAEWAICSCLRDTEQIITQVGQQAALWKALSQILFPSSNHRNLPITNLYAKKNPKPAACELLIISTVWLITYCVEAINRQWESLNELESLGSPSVPGGEMAPYSGSPFSVWRGEAAQAPHVLGCGRGQASPHPPGSFLPKGAPGVDCLNPTPLLLPTPPRLLTLLQLQSGKTVLVDTRNWSL